MCDFDGYLAVAERSHRKHLANLRCIFGQAIRNFEVLRFNASDFAVVPTSFNHARGKIWTLSLGWSAEVKSSSRFLLSRLSRVSRAESSDVGQPGQFSIGIYGPWEVHMHTHKQRKPFHILHSSHAETFHGDEMKTPRNAENVPHHRWLLSPYCWYLLMLLVNVPLNAIHLDQPFIGP